MWHFGITQSQHCNNDNNDNMMHVRVRFERILMSKPVMDGKDT